MTGLFEDYIQKLKSITNVVKKLKFSVIIVPDSSKTNLSSKTISFRNTWIIFLSYNILLLILFGFFLNPVKEYFFPVDGYSIDELKEIEVLNERMNILLLEVEHLKKMNNQLNNILLLTDTTSTDTITKKQNLERRKLNGNIFFAFQLFIERYFTQSGIFFKKPMNGFVSNGFNVERGHYGIDYSAAIGTPLFAAANGYVVFSDFTVNDGFMLIINHTNNYTTVYKHCSLLFKNVRDFVIQGETIALSGNSGKLTTGPHLHFEIWRDGIPIDPKTLLLNY
jgi:murein DD-endopeptidase MepM/ murein hydrolase activator NlpD